MLYHLKNIKVMLLGYLRMIQSFMNGLYKDLCWVMVQMLKLLWKNLELMGFTHSWKDLVASHWIKLKNCLKVLILTCRGSIGVILGTLKRYLKTTIKLLLKAPKISRIFTNIWILITGLVMLLKIKMVKNR